MLVRASTSLFKTLVSLYDNVDRHVLGKTAACMQRVCVCYNVDKEQRKAEQ
jgi:hypothetical protein